jgi:hypothetical protein
MEKLCQICNNNKIEMYQLNFEVYIDCWMSHSTPKISYVIFKFEILTFGFSML